MAGHAAAQHHHLGLHRFLDRADDFAHPQPGQRAVGADVQLLVQADGFVLSELVPSRSPAVGETAILEYEFAYTDGVPDTSYDRRFRHPVAEHLLEVHFAALPATCHGYRLDSPGGPERDVTDVPLSPAAPAHLFTSGGGPGSRGMRWSWP
ncbi:hypothetical protein [Amycolatopsis sp. MEPSY49]|uniref:hypothetical protein n=1 Tax=Amycolatopsis sp. MEPSY49 TaxID=3151600 RepID=UPI003EF26928